jgi:L-lactate dehydrogenase complex protein LldG
MTAREDILSHFTTTDPIDEYRALPRTYLRRHHEGDLPDLLATRIRHYNATAQIIKLEDLPATLSEALRSGTYIVPEGLPEPWLTAVPARRIATEDTDLDRATGAITGCAVAIAETGTLILDHGPGQGRRETTLIPDHHIVILNVDQIEADVPDALTRLDITHPLTFISGPSATSDIELSRVEGVHGPRVLDVILIEQSPLQNPPDLG